MNNYNTICLSGGGISGISQISALEYLNKNKIINFNNINLYVGTSVGSIISFLIIIGYKPNYIIEFIKKFDFNKIKEDFDIDKLFLNYGINNFTNLMIIIKSFLYNKFNISDITFRELYLKTNKKLSIIATNLTKNREEYFSLDTTPDFSVLLAIRMSISLPIISTPVKYNNDLYVDGGCFNNFPINYCDKNTTLGIAIHINSENKINNLIDYLKSYYELYFKVNNNKHNYNKDNVIILEGLNTSNYDNDTINNFLKSGIIKAKEFSENKPLFIVKNLLNEIINNLVI